MIRSQFITLTADHHYEDETGRRIPGVSSILRGAGVRPEPYVGRTVHGVDVMAKALQRGRDVHRLTRAIDETFDEYDALDDTFDPADLSPENANYVAAYHRFLGLSNYRPVAWEKIVYHPEYDYAGRADMIGWLGSERILADRKTERQLHRAVWLQLCFYRMAWEACFPELPIDQTYALVLKDDTMFELKPNPLERGGDAFCVAAIWMNRWQKLVL